jgi:hypothetical protein
MKRPTIRRLMGYAAAFVIGVILGGAAVFGFVVAPLSSTVSWLTVTQSSEDTYMLYRFGAYPLAREAILGHIQLVEAFAREEQGSHQWHGGPADLVFWHGRLALAAERAGDSSEVARSLERAVEIARADGGAVTPAGIRAAVLEQDVNWDARLKSPKP